MVLLTGQAPALQYCTFMSRTIPWAIKAANTIKDVGLMCWRVKIPPALLKGTEADA